ncbi:MAG TPA: hypothetical protein VFZ21_25085, partial [Gemmatimonadaceae bacterium]|nr:hypothetical protein [Gemmatimonadaceae bacterium]
MRVRRSFRRFLILPAAMTGVAVSSSTALAQGRQLFDWSGRVDREVRISMRGRDARAQSAGRYDMQRSRLSVATALPQRDGRVFVRVEDGRGDVDVVQQPSARNNYTTIVRIRDRSSGTDVYRISAYWAPDGPGNGGWDGRDNYPPRPRRDDDDRYGRDRDGRWDDRDGWGRDYDRYGSDVLRWSGDVDDALEIRIQGNRVDYRTL